jgi:uncharacterized protein related to proFAR isomerase
VVSDGLPEWDAVEDVHAIATPSLHFDGEFDRVYHAGDNALHLQDGSSLLQIEQSPSWAHTVVWNPGAEKSLELPDLPDDGFARMLCVEAAQVFETVHLEPQEEWQGWQAFARGRLKMLAKRIIPCLDVTGGRVVKGVNFVELRDAGDPVEIAARYNDQGADELTFLDITATSDARDVILHIIEAVASQVFIPLTVGGGVRTVDDVRRLLNAGADKTSFNSPPLPTRKSFGTHLINTVPSASWWLSTPSVAARKMNNVSVSMACLWVQAGMCLATADAKT